MWKLRFCFSWRLENSDVFIAHSSSHHVLPVPVWTFTVLIVVALVLEVLSGNEEREAIVHYY